MADTKQIIEPIRSELDNLHEQIDRTNTSFRESIVQSRKALRESYSLLKGGFFDDVVPPSTEANHPGHNE